jgi:2-dehydropantoate 2-reductase
MTRILIVGSGAMACLFGARLSAAGLEVHHLGTWPEGIRALQKTGIKLSGPQGWETYSVAASPEPQDHQNIQLALVLVKSWQTSRAAEQLAGILPSDGVALTLQNGIGSGSALKAALGEERVVRGVTSTGATLLGPGKVRPGGEGEIILCEHPRTDKLVVVLNKAGFRTAVVSDLSAVIWEKLVINTAINPLTGLLGVPNGALLESPAAREIMEQAAEETAAVAAAQGIGVETPHAAQAARKVAAATAENHSSLLQDLLRGAPTEIEAICGAVVARADQLGLPVPVNRLLLGLIRARVELKERSIWKPFTH